MCAKVSNGRAKEEKQKGEVACNLPGIPSEDHDGILLLFGPGDDGGRSTVTLDRLFTMVVDPRSFPLLGLRPIAEDEHLAPRREKSHDLIVDAIVLVLHVTPP